MGIIRENFLKQTMFLSLHMYCSKRRDQQGLFFVCQTWRFSEKLPKSTSNTPPTDKQRPKTEVFLKAVGVLMGSGKCVFGRKIPYITVYASSWSDCCCSKNLSLPKKNASCRLHLLVANFVVMHLVIYIGYRHGCRRLVDRRFRRVSPFQRFRQVWNKSLILNEKNCKRLQLKMSLLLGSLST